jgi:hypothetical protein
MEARMERRTRARWITCASLAAVLLSACSPTPAPVSPSPAVVATPPAPTASPTAATPSPTPSSSPSPAPSATAGVDATIADLTGETVDPRLAHRLPIAVTIDDNRVARPQSGFNAASVVYQAPADGGETRYMMVFQEGDSPQIGPVRSARFYFVQWASEVGAALAHYGGDAKSRYFIKLWENTRITNVDALGKGGKAFHRVASRTAPHNGYTSTAAVRAMAAKLGGPISVPTGLVLRLFADPAATASLPRSQHIVVPYRTGRIDYRFDPATDLYRRYTDGKLQVDPADHKTVTTRNVVVMFMKYSTDTKIEPGHSRPVIGNIGSGRAIVFEEGRHIEGRWSKAKDASPTLLFDLQGHQIPLITGRTFFQIVPLATRISAGP